MKKVFKILTLIMLILTILKITDTYAKYFTEATATKEQDVGQWKILLNTIDLYKPDGTTVEFTLDADNLVQDENVLAGKIAPGGVWGAEIILDPSGTDVAVRYDVEIDPSNIDITGVHYELTIENDGKTLRRIGENTYTGIITLSEVQAGQQEKLVYSVKWDNIEANNTTDTEAASVYGKTFEVPFKIKCTQYLGEDLPAEYAG